MKQFLILTSTFSMLISTAAFAEPMSFKLMGDGGNNVGSQWIQATGDIMPDTADVFRKFSVDYRKEWGDDPVGSVRLNSLGGSLQGGIALGEAIRLARLSTEVGQTKQGRPVKAGEPPNWDEQAPGVCASACAYAFLGGVNRSLGDRDKLGFHQFYTQKQIEAPTEKLFTGKDLDDQQKIMAFLTLYLVKMGVDPRVLIAASNTKAQELLYINGDIARKLRVTFDAVSYQPWRIELYKAGVVALTETADGLQSMTASCSKRYGPNVLLKVKQPSSSTIDWLKQCANRDKVGNFDVFGTQIPATNTLVTTREDGVSVRFLLPPKNIAINSPWIDFDSGRVCMSSTLRAAEENQSSAIYLAMHNCIQD
jgi:hypothetical protein